MPSASHAGGLRYHGMSSIVSELYDQGLMEARSVEQTAVFQAAEDFARIEGILPAPESSHAIRVAIDEAMKCKETGEAKNIVFGLTGTGYFDMYAYKAFNDGEMGDYIPSDAEIKKATDLPEALPTPPPPLIPDPGPAPTATPRPTLMPLPDIMPEGARIATVENIAEDSSLNLRALPSAGAEILMRLFCHQPLLVLEQSDVPGWVYVRTDSMEGYVMESYLQYEE